MGIYRFYSQFLSRIGERVIIKGLPQRLSPHGIEGVIFDLNGMLHNVAQRVFMYGKAKQDAIRAGTLEEFMALKQVQNATKSFQELMDLYVQELAKELNETLTILSPKQYIIIAVDGMVPGAKILQQRSRRYKGFVDSALGSEDDKPIGGFNTTMISPGTPFMNDVDTYLRAWISQGLDIRKEWLKSISRVASRPGASPPKQPRGLFPGVLYYSSHLVNGEGEHKAFAAVRDFIEEFSITQGSGAHVVYGADADLSMLSLLSPLRNILLSRENLSQYVDIEELYIEIRKKMTRNETAASSEFSRENICADFVLISNLIGNDFLPSSVAFQTMGNVLLDAYAAIGSPLTLQKEEKRRGTSSVLKVSDVILSSLGNYFYILSTKEPALLIENANSELRDRGTPRERVKPSTVLLEAFSSKDQSLNFEKFRSKWYEEAANYRNDSIAQSLPYYYGGVNVPDDVVVPVVGEKTEEEKQYDLKTQGLFKSTSQAMRRMVCDYVSTMAWVLRYYEAGGKAVNWLHAYRFVVAPLTNDIARIIIEEYPKVVSSKKKSPKTIPFHTAVDFYSMACVLASDQGNTGFTNQDGDPRARGKSAIPLSIQLLIITPPSEIEKVLASARELALLTSSDSGALAFIAPNDPQSIPIYLDGKRAKYEGIPILPEINFMKIFDIVKNYEALYRTSKLEEAKTKREKKEKEGYGPHIDKFGREKIIPLKVKALIPMKLSSVVGDEPIIFKPSEVVREAVAAKLGKKIIITTASEEEREKAAEQIETSKIVRAVGEGEMGGSGRWGVGSIEDLEEEIKQQQQQQQRVVTATTTPAPVVPKAPDALPPSEVSSAFPTFSFISSASPKSPPITTTVKPKPKPRAKKTAETVVVSENTVPKKPPAKRTKKVTVTESS